MAELAPVCDCVRQVLPAQTSTEGSGRGTAAHEMTERRDLRASLQGGLDGKARPEHGADRDHTYTTRIQITSSCTSQRKPSCRTIRIDRHLEMCLMVPSRTILLGPLPSSSRSLVYIVLAPSVVM